LNANCNKVITSGKLAFVDKPHIVLLVKITRKCMTTRGGGTNPQFALKAEFHSFFNFALLLI
jgi:hypothetical protein